MITGNLVEIQDLGIRIRNEFLFRNLNLAVAACENILVTGPSGCGKSTLLKILALLEHRTEGAVLLEGKNMDSFNPEKYRKSVSYCYQSPQLFDRTVRQNVTFPFEIRGKTVDWTLVENYLLRFHLSKDILSKDVEMLSGGERQRIGLIRNLLFLPKLLLLDEITSSLDQENKDLVHKEILSITKENNIAVLSVSHDLREIDGAEKIWLFNQGKIEIKA